MIPGIDDRLTVAVLSSLLTFAVTRLLDRVRRKDEIAVFAKGTALPLIVLARALESHSRMMSEALGADDEKLRAFYKFVIELVGVNELEELQANVRASSKCPHDVLVCLRESGGAIARARTRYEQVRQTLEMSPNLRGDSEGLHRMITNARDATRFALERLRKVSATDTQREIAHLQQEFR